MKYSFYRLTTDVELPVLIATLTFGKLPTNLGGLLGIEWTEYYLF